MPAMRGLAVIAAKLGSRTNPLALSFAAPLLSTFITSASIVPRTAKGAAEAAPIALLLDPSPSRLALKPTDRTRIARHSCTENSWSRSHRSCGGPNSRTGDHGPNAGSRVHRDPIAENAHA